MLGETHEPGADKLRAAKLDDLHAGKIARNVQLDLVEAAGRRGTPVVKEKLSAYEKRLDDLPGLTQYADCLAGGDAENGRRVFREHIQAACVRCHKIAGEGGDAAPDLTQIGFRGSRNYILESIIDPNAKIAAGFENVQDVLNNGTSAAGVVKRETDQELDLFSLEDGLVTIKKGDIKSRTITLSGMPDNLRQILHRREIRDLVEYLSGLR